MGRLSFTSRAFVQRIKMIQSARLVLVVEGKSHDGWYYEKLCRAEPKLSKIGIMTFTSSSIGRELGAANVGGKKGVLLVHDYLRARNLLAFGSGRSRKAVMCCLDADHDRVRNKIRRSRNITYTRLPDVEAHLLSGCDEVELFACILSASEVQMLAAKSQFVGWQKSYAEIVRNWVIACHTSAEIPIINGPSADTAPPLQKTPPFSLKKDELTRIEKASRSAVSEDEYVRANRLAVSRINGLYEKGRQLELLKGKWLAGYLAALLLQYAKANDLGSSCGKDVVIACAKGLQKFEGKWVEYFQGRVLRLLEDEAPTMRRAI